MRELQILLLILLTALALTISCDTTSSSFDETIPELYSLTTEVNPQGSGRIEPSRGDYEVNDRIDIEAFPSEGYVFERWEGDITGNTNPEAVVFDGEKRITAWFSPRDYPLNITISGEGTVTEVVESRSAKGTGDDNLRQNLNTDDLQVNPDYVNSPLNTAISGSEIQDNNFGPVDPASVTVKLIAEPSEGWYFDRWEEDLTGDVNPETITVDEEKNVTAVFLQEDTDGFSIKINITGRGSVNKNPDRTFFNDGDEVTLTANPDDGWTFNEWQGDLTGDENSKTVIMKESIDVTAVFGETDDPSMKLTQQPSGTTAGAAIEPAPEIKVTDGLGEPLQGVEVSVSLSENTFAAGTTEMVLTNQEGVASFNNLIIETAFPDYILTFDANEPDVSDISSYPFGVFAAAGAPSNSRAAVPEGEAGKKTSINIFVDDRFGNAVSGAADELSVNVSGANSASAGANSGDSPGEYIAYYTPENTGEDRISIQLAGVPVEGSPFVSIISVSGSDPANSTATVPDGSAGEETVIAVLVKDRFGNLVSDVAEQLTVDISGANNASPQLIEGGSPGEYTSGYIPEKSGTDQISIQLGGVPIDGSPFESDVAAALADPSNSKAIITDGVAGEETVITVLVMDRFGNDVGNATGELSVNVSGANSRTPSVTETNIRGQYVAKYNPVNSGSDQISIQLGGVPIDGSPFESNVDPAGADPLSSTASVPDGMAGGETVISIFVKDQFGNNVNNVAEQLSVNVSGANSASLSVNEGDSPGVYVSVYIPENTGEDQVSVQLGSEPIDGSPFVSTIAPAVPDPANSTASVPDGKAGEETIISIFVQDRFGNDVIDADGDLTVNVSGANSASLSVNEGDSPGEYVTGYIPENTGEDQILIQLGSEPIAGSPFMSDVVPATADPFNSTASVPDGKAGDETVITIFVRDRFGNDVINAAGDLTVNVSGANSATLPVNEGNSPGLYTASYIPEKSGTDQISVQLGNEPVEGSPLESDVAAATVDPSNSLVSADPNLLSVEQVSEVRIELMDRFFNPVAGLSENDFDINTSGDAIAGKVEETSVAGTYISEVKSTKTGGVRVSVNVNGINLDNEPTIMFEPGAPEKMEITTQPQDSRTGQPVGGPPSVLVIDRFGNPVPGMEVTVSEENGAQFFNSILTETTNERGLAVFDEIIMNRLSGTFRLVFSMDGIADVSSESFEVRPSFAPN